MEDNPYSPPRVQPGGFGMKPPYRERAAVAVALAGSVLLAFAGWHVRADRTHRRPVVTFVGPAAAWVPQLAGAGWILSLVALGLVARERSITSGQMDRTFFAVLGLFVAFANVFLSCLFWAAMTED